MNCDRTRRLLPLFAGGDLQERKARRVREHLETCAECRRELEEYRKAMRAVADAVRVTTAGDWTPGEWRAVMDRVAKEKREPREPGRGGAGADAEMGPGGRIRGDPYRGCRRKPVAPGFPLKTAGTRPGLSAGERAFPARESGAGLPGLAAPGTANQPSASKRGGPTAAAPDSSKQDVLTMTLVSPDTGLQVVWVFNRNFDWKGESN